jgi:hypothetical protein
MLNANRKRHIFELSPTDSLHADSIRIAVEVMVNLPRMLHGAGL